MSKGNVVKFQVGSTIQRPAKLLVLIVTSAVFVVLVTLDASAGTNRYDRSSPVVLNANTMSSTNSSPRAIDGVSGFHVRTQTTTSASTEATSGTQALSTPASTPANPPATPIAPPSPTPPTTTTTPPMTTTTTSPSAPPKSKSTAAAPAWTSTKWSGYVMTGASGSYSAVGAQWVVPTLNCAATPNGATSDWVGLNGWNGAPGLFQAGTSSQCVNGQEVSTACWSDAANNDVFVALFNVSPGDVVATQVYQTASMSLAYSVTDLTDGKVGSAATTFIGSGSTAEWIAEDNADANTAALFPLADFGTVTFQDLSVTTTTGVSSLPPNAESIAMVSPAGKVEATPGDIQGSTSSAAFTVDYKEPSAGGSILYSIPL